MIGLVRLGYGYNTSLADTEFKYASRIMELPSLVLGLHSKKIKKARLCRAFFIGESRLNYCSQEVKLRF
jgi:hypothetical protein